MQCHSCTATRDSLNGTVGIGDDNCFDNAQVRFFIGTTVVFHLEMSLIEINLN